MVCAAHDRIRLDLQTAGNLAGVPLGTGLSCLLLALALMLLLFLMLDETIVGALPWRNEAYLRLTIVRTADYSSPQ